MEKQSAGLWPHYYYGWNIVATVVLVQMASLGVAINCFSLFIPMWSQEFGVSISTLVSAITLFSFGCALFAFPAGMAADRHSVRMIMVLGLIIVAVVHGAIGFASASWHVILLYALFLPIGITMSAAITAQALVSRWFVRKRGLAMGLTAIGIAAAGVIFPPIISVMLLSLGWRLTWWSFAGFICLIVIPVALLVLRDRPRSQDGNGYVPDHEDHHTALRMPVSEIFRRPNFWANIWAFLPLQIVSFAVSVNLAPIVASRGFSLQTAGFMLATFSACALASKLAVGMLSDRFGNKLPYILLCVIAASGCVLLAHAQDSALLYGSVMMIGMIGGIWTLLAATTAMEFGGSAFGRAYGVASALTPIGAVGPPFLAFAKDWSGEYSTALYALAGVALCGGASALCLREKRHLPVPADAAALTDQPPIAV